MSTSDNPARIIRDGVEFWTSARLVDCHREIAPRIRSVRGPVVDRLGAKLADLLIEFAPVILQALQPASALGFVEPCTRPDHAGSVDALLQANLRNQLDVADRKSTRLNSSHQKISYAVFCLKKK